MTDEKDKTSSDFERSRSQTESHWKLGHWELLPYVDDKTARAIDRTFKAIPIDQPPFNDIEPEYVWRAFAIVARYAPHLAMDPVFTIQFLTRFSLSVKEFPHYVDISTIRELVRVERIITRLIRENTDSPDR